jgi:hypothetical protein
MELTHPLAALPQVDAWVRSQIAALCQEPRAFEWDLLDPARRKVLITVGTLATALAGHAYLSRVPGSPGPRDPDDETTIRSEDEISCRTDGGFSPQQRHWWRPLLDH